MKTRGLIITAACLLLAACGSSGDGASPAAISEPAVGNAVGNRAIDFTLKDESGRDVRLADFRGSVVLIEFSAMW